LDPDLLTGLLWSWHTIRKDVKEVKLFLHIPWWHTGVVDVQLHLFLTSALEGGVVSLTPQLLYPSKRCT